MVFIRATEILSKKATHSKQNLAHNGGNTEGKAQANVPESLLQGILLRQIWEEIHTVQNTPIGAENNPSPPNSQGSKDNQRSDFSADFSFSLWSEQATTFGPEPGVGPHGISSSYLCSADPS